MAELVAGFPKDFAYFYASDGAVISKLSQIYSPYIGNEVGGFVYYKAMDIHTFQSVIDGLPPSLEVGQTKLTKASNIDLGGGNRFHNGPSTILFQRIDERDGQKFGFFKVVTMGNVFLPVGGDPSYTNYQYTFHVALDGPFQGLLIDGDLQETVTTRLSKVDKSVLTQRQLSVRMRPPSAH